MKMYLKIDQLDEDWFCFENSYTLWKFKKKKGKFYESDDMKFYQCDENLLQLWKSHPFNEHLSLWWKSSTLMNIYHSDSNGLVWWNLLMCWKFSVMKTDWYDEYSSIG